MKKLLVLATLLFGFTNIYAQEGGETLIEDEYTALLAKNTLFAEAEVVNGMVYSLNFDRIIIAKPAFKLSTTAGAGVSSLAFDGDIDPVVTIHVNGLLGKSSHRLEVGVGVLAAIGDQYTEESEGYITENGTQVWKFTPAREHTSLHLTGRLGYRFQRETGGLFLRAGIMPSYALYTIAEDVKLQLGGTIGIGYTFKNKPKTVKE